MNTKSLFFTLILFICIQGKAQTVQEFFGKSPHEVYWMGIDFSHVQLVGEFAHFFGTGEKGPDELATHYFPAWNELIISEPRKYDVQSMVSKPRMKYDLDYITSRNSKVEPNRLKVLAADPYSEADIKKFVSEYDYKKKKGFGVILLAESMDKVRKQAYFHLIILNAETNECLFTQRIKGEPQGFGVRNYWGGAIYDAIEIIGSNYRGWAHKNRK